jgi:hypothetical protein
VKTFTVSRIGWAALAAVVWCSAFAGLHLYWALGGSAGLASSAGQRLASSRPESFVLFGLYGVALLLLAGALVNVVPSGLRPGRQRSAAVVLLAIVGAALLLRGAGLEALLAANVGGVRTQVGGLETHWSQLLRNPWFALGGLLFLASAARLYRHPARSRPSP